MWTQEVIVTVIALAVFILVPVAFLGWMGYMILRGKGSEDVSSRE
ncbi:hypothetical protein [Calditerricola satsumensis]|uniref:Uncharacterized protein n=1 Tax=Calditerricola satsumensis TaxID=373054 RepID=A0A8J3B9S2_9BACI|nr:hypothetical protein [Calditerricola satsumensis]GGJ91486.1 hypothetical protein GCM10007043_01510 [Calditerricola satsumensis]